MKTNNQSHASSEVVMRKTAGLAATMIVFLTAVFLAVFLFIGRAGAQNFSQYEVPSAVCQEYRSYPGYSIIRNLTNDCLVRTGDNQAGFTYVHAYNTGRNFCVEMTNSKIGQIMAPQCSLITQSGGGQQPTQQQQQPTQSAQQKQIIPKIVTPPSFQIKELQYDTLPHGKPIHSGDNERIEITMPDGSVIQIDADATFTPVSDYEVQSVFGRYRYMWQPFHDGKCIVGQNLVRQACRKVKTRDAVLGVTGTEFLVETDKSGTTVTVLEGLLSVADLNGKKTIEVAGGESAYIKHGGLPAEPKLFDPAEIERWWEKKTSDQIAQETVSMIIGGGLILFFILLIIKIFAGIKRIFQGRKNEKPVLAAGAAVEEKKDKIDHKGSAVVSFVIGIFAATVSLSFFSASSSFFSLLNMMFFFMSYNSFFFAGIIGLILGVIGLRSSRKIFAILGIILNIIGILFYYLFITR